MRHNWCWVQSLKLVELWNEAYQNIHQGKNDINDRLVMFHLWETGSDVVNNASGKRPGWGF